MDNYYQQIEKLFFSMSERISFSVKVWRMVVILCLVLSIIFVSVLVYAGSQSDIQSKIGILDSKYLPIELGKGYEIVDQRDPRVLKAVLTNFVVGLRQVTLDRAYQEKRIRELSYYARSGTKAFEKIVQILGDEKLNPFYRVKEEIVNVKVESVKKETEVDYEVVWEELISGRSAGFFERKKFRGIIEVSFLDEFDEQFVLLNPIGLIVEEFNIFEER